MVATLGGERRAEWKTGGCRRGVSRCHQRRRCAVERPYWFGAVARGIAAIRGRRGGLVGYPPGRARGECRLGIEPAASARVWRVGGGRRAGTQRVALSPS